MRPFVRPLPIVSGDTPHANCMFMQHHAYFFLCPRYSPLCPSVKVSASPSPGASTPLLRSHGCARRAPCHAPTPPTSASTTNPTSPRCPDAPTTTARRSPVWSTPARHWWKKDLRPWPAGLSTSAPVVGPTSTPPRSDGPSPAPCWCAPCSRTTYRSGATVPPSRSEEHTSELQSRFDLVCRLLLEKTKTIDL